MSEKAKGRLDVAAEFIEKTENFADIGCDHGYLSRFVLENNLADHVFACDISDKSLDKARQNLKNFSSVSYVCMDGAEFAKDFDGVIAICGLGGGEIVRIIEFSHASSLILQPQNFVSGVRRALNKFGYKIIGDKLAYDRGKFYDIIKAEKGSQTLDEERYEWGVFSGELPPLLIDRLEFTAKKLEKFPQTPENIHKAQIIANILNKK